MYETSNSASNTSSSTQQQQTSNRNSATVVNQEEIKKKLLAWETKLTKRTEKAVKSKFIKFADGQYMRLKFLPEMTEEDMITYNDGDQPVLRFKFFCQQIEDGVTSDQIQEWTVSPMWAKVIIHQFNRGISTLDITRHGASMTNTRYDIDPVV